MVSSTEDKEDADNIAIEVIDTQHVADDNQRVADAGAEAENVLNTDKWTPTEIKNLLNR